MSAAPFDTHATVKRLTGAGMDTALAEAVTEAVAQAHRQSLADLATKADIERLELTGKADIERLESRIDNLRHETDLKLERMHNHLLRWMIALIAPIYALLIVAFFAG